MEYKLLGNSNLRVSPLTVGCWSFGGDSQSYWGIQNQDEVNRLISEALDLGVNFFDTAFIYNAGASEISLGTALSGKRNHAIICNKIPVLPYEELKCYEEKIVGSLNRLNTDYIDIMMIHWPVKDVKLLRANLEALLNARERGLIHHIGVSNFGIRTLEIAIEYGIYPIADELVYNLISRGIEYEIIPYCLSKQIGIITYMPLMQGILTGKYTSIENIPSSRKRTIHFNSETNTLSRHHGPGVELELMIFIKKLRALSNEYGLTPGQMAIAWLCSKKGVSSVIAGCRNSSQLRENVKATETFLSDEMISELEIAGEEILKKLGANADLWEDIVNSRVW